MPLCGSVNLSRLDPLPFQWRIYIVKFWTRAPPPGGPNSFNFMQFWENLAKSYVGAPPRGVGAPSSGKSWIRHCFSWPFPEILKPHLPYLSIWTYQETTGFEIWQNKRDKFRNISIGGSRVSHNGPTPKGEGLQPIILAIFPENSMNF